MAHLYAEHRQHRAEKARAKHLLKDYAGGGEIHGDEAADEKLIRKMVKGAALKMDGTKGARRIDKRARGGKVGKTNVTVVIAPQNGQPQPPVPMMPPPGPMPPPMPPGGPMAGAMPPGGPPMPPPGMPGQKRGGRAFKRGGKVGAGWNEGLKNGTQVQHTPGKNDTKDIVRPKQITYATGGPVEAGKSMGLKMTAGAESGEGRMQKIKAYGGK